MDDEGTRRLGRDGALLLHHTLPGRGVQRPAYAAKSSLLAVTARHMLIPSKYQYYWCLLNTRIVRPSKY